MMFSSSSSGDNEDFNAPQSELIETKNTYWLDTLFWSLPCEFDKWLITDHCRSKYFKIPTLDEIFYFQAGKSSLTSLSIKLQRVLPVDHDRRLDEGYFLRVYFSLLGSRKRPVQEIMDCDSDVISVEFEMDSYYFNPFLPLNSTVKCVIKMYELSCLQNENKREQDDILQRTTKKLAEHSKFADISHLLRYNKHEDLFSGRQSRFFAEIKCKFMERSLVYVSEIAHKLGLDEFDGEALDANINMSIYLGYINSGEMKPIKAKECAKLYVLAHHFGLEYLQQDCTEFLENYFETYFLIDILIVADMVYDIDLMYLAVETFLKNKHKMLTSDRWNNLKNASCKVAESILDALQLYVNPQHPSESQNSSTSVV